MDALVLGIRALKQPDHVFYYDPACTCALCSAERSYKKVTDARFHQAIEADVRRIDAEILRTIRGDFT